VSKDTVKIGNREAPDASGGRELWGSRLGFLLAAVGSAVGLGNMWRFSYATAEHGGAAFVLFYLALTFLIGIPVMIAEFGLGRSTRRSPISALKAAGGAAWIPLGFLFVAAGFLILGTTR
jgi:neurotransmitter:Na+ symporter, NSS family